MLSKELPIYSFEITLKMVIVNKLFTLHSSVKHQITYQYEKKFFTKYRFLTFDVFSHFQCHPLQSF